MIPALLQRRWRDRRTGREGSLRELDDGRQLDPVGVATLLGHGGLIGRRSVLRDIQAVVPPLGLAPPAVTAAELTPDARIDHLWALLCDAVRASCAGSKRVRIALSGGLDSRAIGAAAVHVGVPGIRFSTFGDSDCPDLPASRALAAALGRPHDVAELALDAALQHEARVWDATDGLGGPASSPGASTDLDWADCDVLLSGCSGDVIWGDTRVPGPSPAARLRKLGIRPLLDDAWAPDPPDWVVATDAWQNLHTRQRAVTWTGVLPRLVHTPVVPVAWYPPLLAFALTLSSADRDDRLLLRRMLERHALAVSIAAVPAVKTSGVHDLDRAWQHDPSWGDELALWVSDAPEEIRAFEAIGVARKPAVRMIDQVRRGARKRAGFLSRLRALRRWGLTR